MTLAHVGKSLLLENGGRGGWGGQSERAMARSEAKVRGDLALEKFQKKVTE